MDLILEREYTDITRQDSSFGFRNDWRTGWDTGEHLWDVDLNNNWQFVNWWRQTNLYHFRTPRSPWTNMPSTQRYIQRTPGEYQNWLRYQSFGAEGQNLPPFIGANVYAQADRLLLYFTGSAWKPVRKMLPYRPGIEIAMFAHYPHAGEVCCSYTATEKFTIYGDGPNNRSPLSRFRSNRGDTTVNWYKNGVQVGTANYSTTGTRSGRVIVTSGEVTFDKGDILTVRAPNPLMGVLWLSITFIGKVIQE